MDNPSEQIARNVKWFRNKNGWSLDRASTETGVSKAMLGQIERGESSPTIATLWKIVKGFSISLSSLLEKIPEEHDQPVTVFRDANELRQKIADDNMLISPLFPYDPMVAFEYFEITVPPGYDRLSVPHKRGVIEYITVFDGEMEVLSEDVWHHLDKGQSLRFQADRPHGYRNLSDHPAVALNVINYPGRK